MAKKLTRKRAKRAKLQRSRKIKRNLSLEQLRDIMTYEIVCREMELLAKRRLQDMVS